MDQETQKIIDQQFKNLPEDMQFALVSADYKTKLQDITKRQRLLIDQAGKLEMETTLVMIGLEPLRDYVSNLQRELAVSAERAKEIATDVSENIFKPIRGSLRSINQDLEEEPAPEKTDLELESGHAVEWGSTDTSDASLNRDQILSEIEDPSLIVDTTPTTSPRKESATPTNPGTQIETLDEVPYQQDIKINTPQTERVAPKSSLLETKLSDITITPQKTVTAVPTVKLPTTDKKRPSSGTDPYREPIE